MIKLIALIFILGCANSPKPKALIVHDEHGISIQVECPDGWTGHTKWHKDSSLNYDDQYNQYIEDANSGICVKDDDK